MRIAVCLSSTKIEELETEDEETVPPEEEPVEMDDDAIVEAVQFPIVKANFTRWIIALVVIVAVIYSVRVVVGPSGFIGRETATTEEGLAYAIGDVISHPADELDVLKVKLDKDLYAELAPGSSIRLDQPGTMESSRIALLGGRIIYTSPFLGRMAVVDTDIGDVGTLGGRLFVELWGQKGQQRLRVGVFNGTADLKGEVAGSLQLPEGSAAFVGDDLRPCCLIPGINKWPGIDARLDRWVFPSLVEIDDPTVNDVIESVCRQAGLRVDIPEYVEFADFPVGESISRWGAHRAGDVLEGFGLQWGFRHEIHDDELRIIPLDEGEHIAAIGEWALFHWAELDDIFWPDRFIVDASMNIRQKLGNMAHLSAAPIEQRLGAFALLIASPASEGDDSKSDLIDAELDIAFDINQPYHLRRLAFEDLYGNPDIAPEKIVPLLETSKLDITRTYFRLRTWGPPAWGDPGVWGVYEPALAGKIESDESDAGLLYLGFIDGTIDYKTAAEYSDTAMASGDKTLVMEVTRYLHDLALNTPPNVNPAFISYGLKSAFDANQEDLLVLGMDGIRLLAERLDADFTLMWLIDPFITEPGDPVTRYAAAALGSLLEFHPWDDEDQWNNFVTDRVAEIADVDSVQGEVTMYILGLFQDLNVEPCLADEVFTRALEERLEKIEEPAGRLYVLRLIRAQRDGFEGNANLAWADGIAASVLGEILQQTDPNFLVEVILTLNLYGETGSASSGEYTGLHSVLDKFFVSLAEHSDPRLRWLALQYILNNKPAGAKIALARLAGDEYPLIAETASAKG